MIAVFQARHRHCEPRRCSAKWLGVLIGGIVLVIGGAACSVLPGGEISCGKFLNEDIVNQEDIVDKALGQNGLSADDYADLALTTQQLRNSCSRAGDQSVTLNDIIGGSVDGSERDSELGFVGTWTSQSDDGDVLRLVISSEDPLSGRLVVTASDGDKCEKMWSELRRSSDAVQVSEPTVKGGGCRDTQREVKVSGDLLTAETPGGYVDEFRRAA